MTAPTYLQDEFLMFTPTTTTNLRPGRGRDQLMFKMEKRANDKETITDEMKKEWNKLPFNLRNEKSMTIFKSHLKAHFFVQAFENPTN